MVRPVALPTITNDSALGGTVIEKSVRFHDGDGAYFRRDASSTGIEELLLLVVGLRE